ncbi:hypothetical protein [Actinokineospora inagensis]|uniref:hypothetical protein n=1 Tax=Actinokineospora inagensis TaxID=103730 RepID=UPI0004137B28|nr:hypothetical protein [Actinokineospora inagensis]
MRTRIIGAALAVSALALTAVAVSGTAAEAKGRPCGPPSTTDGVGSAGTAFTLKSMYDDDGPGLVAGEEFEINTEAAGQHWTVTFSDNGVVFFANPDDVSTATGIREVHPNHITRGTVQHMNAHAVRHDTGEVIDATVVLQPVPDRCGN